MTVLKKIDPEDASREIAKQIKDYGYWYKFYTTHPCDSDEERLKQASEYIERYQPQIDQLRKEIRGIEADLAAATSPVVIEKLQKEKRKYSTVLHKKQSSINEARNTRYGLWRELHNKMNQAASDTPAQSVWQTPLSELGLDRIIILKLEKSSIPTVEHLNTFSSSKLRSLPWMTEHHLLAISIARNTFNNRKRAR